MIALLEKKIIIIVLSSQYCLKVEAAKIRVLLQLPQILNEQNKTLFTIMQPLLYRL